MTILIADPSGSLRSSVAFSTTSQNRFLNGTITTDIVDIQVSINGAPLTSDPSLVLINGGVFTVPNPTSYPNGLQLVSGLNTIVLQPVLLSAAVATPATAAITLVAQSAPFDPPSGVTVEQFSDSVTVTVLGLTNTRVVGYNFYASTESGGGVSGYGRVNLQLVTTSTTDTTYSDLFTLTSDAPAKTATPLVYKAVITQQNSSGAVLSTDVDQSVNMPSTVSVIQTVITVSSQVTNNYFSFNHNRNNDESSNPATVLNGEFSSTPSTEPLYYTVTAVYYDSTTNTEYESYFSPEVVGQPIVLNTQINALSAVARQQILQDAVQSIYRSQDTLDIQPGAVIRDTFLDPFSTESERLRFIIDFIYRASSFDTLLQIDDPQNIGSSIPAANSAYKSSLAAALFLANPSDVQPIVDSAFDKLAGNVNRYRQPGRESIGKIRFYTSIIPTRTLSVQLGQIVSGGGLQFRITQSVSIPIDQLASYYNPSTGQYSVTAWARAVSVGSAGNVGVNQITSGAPAGLSCTNDAVFYGGLDQQTNSQLATVAKNGLASVDTSTAQGYQQTAASTQGVINSYIVRAGSPYMQRDYDKTLQRHLGGKVDAWVQGTVASFITDTFAFQYKRRRDAQFQVIGNPANYIFQSLDTTLSPTNPISSMLNYPALYLGLRNATTGVSYNLTGVSVVNFNTIQLSGSQPPVTLTDIVLGDYNYVVSNSYTFTQQPADYIASVVGESSGTIDPSIITLVHPDSVLGLGRSTAASDYLIINPSSNPSVTAPSGAFITITGEPHLLVGFYPVSVFHIGADSLSVVVTDTTGMITYKGPFDPSGVPDYDIIEGGPTTALSIKRTSVSTIPDGGSVLVSYVYTENMVVTYQVNQVLQGLQNNLNAAGSATADPLAKGSIQVPVDITAVIILKPGIDSGTADPALRANLQYLLSNKNGQPLHQSDVVTTINNTSGILYSIVPLTLMSRAVNSTVSREDLNTSDLTSAIRIDGWSNNRTATWLIKNSLSCETITGGGPYGYFVGVFQDDNQETLILSNPWTLASASNQAYIIGNEGLSIPGYSDNETLLSQGVLPANLNSVRQELSGNRVMVSLLIGDSPASHSYWVTYVVGYSSSVSDITTTPIEYLVPGTITFTYAQT